MKKNKIKLSIVFMVLGTAALACSIPLLVPPANPAEDIGETHAAQMTNVAEDVIATLDAVTSTPSPVPVTNTPVPTSTMLPTQIPAPTKTPVPTEPPAPCNAAAFVKDMTVVDGAIIPTGSPFVKIWRLKNVGSCTWTMDYEITFDGGDKLDGHTVAMPKSVAPGGVVDIAIRMKAPGEKGLYKGYWILRNQHGKTFGVGSNADAPIFVEIKAVATSDNRKLNFANLICKAEWKTDTHTLPCLGNPIAYSNYVFYTKNFSLEATRIEDEPAIIANVETGQRLRGIFPAYTVAAGDHFVTEIGCVGDDTSCKVQIMLRYQVKGTSTHGVLGEWVESHDGTTTLVDIDLTSLAGKEIIFTFDMEAKSGSDTNEVFWFMPSIVD